MTLIRNWPHSIAAYTHACLRAVVSTSSLLTGPRAHSLSTPSPLSGSQVAYHAVHRQLMLHMTNCYHALPPVQHHHQPAYRSQRPQPQHSVTAPSGKQLVRTWRAGSTAAATPLWLLPGTAEDVGVLVAFCHGLCSDIARCTALVSFSRLLTETLP
jgi:hypothetical protein